MKAFMMIGAFCALLFVSSCGKKSTDTVDLPQNEVVEVVDSTVVADSTLVDSIAVDTVVTE